jgi:hypothetical protein
LPVTNGPSDCDLGCCTFDSANLEDACPKTFGQRTGGAGRLYSIAEQG